MTWPRFSIANFFLLCTTVLFVVLFLIERHEKNDYRNQASAAIQPIMENIEKIRNSIRKRELDLEAAKTQIENAAPGGDRIQRAQELIDLKKAEIAVQLEQAKLNVQEERIGRIRKGKHPNGR